MNPDQQPTLLASLRALPRPAWILFFGTFLNKFGTFVVPFLALYLTREGYSYAQVALAIGAYGAGHLLASILGGHLADRIGRRKTIVISMFSASASMLLLSQAHSYPLIVALTVLAGLTGEMYRPAASAMLTDLIPAGQRVTAFSAYRMAFNAGWAFGPATAGFLAERGYVWLFIGDALTSALYGVVALFALPEVAHTQAKESGWSEAWKVLRQDRKFQQVVLAMSAIFLVFFQMSATLGLYVTHLGFSSATYGTIISLNGVLVVLFELPLTTITRRYPARKVMAVGYLLVGTGFALNAIAHTVPALMAALSVATFGEMLALPMTSALIADLAPPHMRGRYMGASGFVAATALIFAPGAGLWLFQAGPTILWLACGAMGMLASGIILYERRSRAAATAEC